MDRKWFVTFLCMFIQLNSLNLSVCKKLSKWYSSLDYYNYYYGGYSQNPEASDTQKGLNTAAPSDATNGNETTEVITSNEAAAAASTAASTAAAIAEVSDQPENSVVAATTEVCFYFDVPEEICLEALDF